MSGFIQPVKNETAAANMEVWPGPIVDLFLGKSSVEQVNELVARGHAKTNQGCDARFFIAEWHLLEGRKEAATTLLREARMSCPVGKFERTAADLELKRIEK